MSIRYEQLIAYAAGELDEHDRRTLEVQLAADEDARRTVERYRVARLTLAEDDSIEAPAEAIRRVKAIFDPAALARPAATGRWWAALDRLLAELTFDSRLQAAAVRYAERGERLQLTYECPEAEIDVQAERVEASSSRDPARWRLTGQVAADRGVSATRVVLLRDDEPVVETQADDRGLFELETPDGSYELCVAVGERLLVLPIGPLETS